MKRIFLLFFIVGGIFLSGCETLSALPSSFNNKNIMEIKGHMSSETILNTFGNPVNVSSTMCGKEEKWACTTWTYGEYSYGYATFTFYHEDSKLYLNHFEIDRD